MSPKRVASLNQLQQIELLNSQTSGSDLHIKRQRFKDRSMFNNDTVLKEGYQTKGNSLAQMLKDKNLMELIKSKNEASYTEKTQSHFTEYSTEKNSQ